MLLALRPNIHSPSAPHPLPTTFASFQKTLFGRLCREVRLCPAQPGPRHLNKPPAQVYLKHELQLLKVLLSDTCTFFTLHPVSSL